MLFWRIWGSLVVISPRKPLLLAPKLSVCLSWLYIKYLVPFAQQVPFNQQAMCVPGIWSGHPQHPILNVTATSSAGLMSKKPALSFNLHHLLPEQHIHLSEAFCAQFLLIKSHSNPETHRVGIITPILIWLMRFKKDMWSAQGHAFLFVCFCF